MAAQNEESKGLGGSAYARRTKRLIKLIGNIRALGGQGVVDLPRIAVIGNQSAGKSSLIEAISGITVPRSVGTCTRCPMECRLTQQSGSKWRAQVFLRRETEADGRPAKDVQERVFGNVIESNEELEVMIRRAQLAILNPSVAPDHFLTIDLEVPAASSSHRKDELAFSSNVVCVTVWGPDVPDLSFIDLPGIIQNETEKGSMNAVKSMVMKHIQGNCLILLAISMRDDIENQSAAYLAKHVDPSGLRTLGVLTKSDLVQEGEERGWLDILEGRIHRLHHGYFITKQPAPKDVEEKITHAAARAAERRYFAEHPLWADRSAEVRSRMGTVQLGQTLSKLLSQLINRTLPTLREDVLTQLALTQKRLSEFPQKLSQPPAVALLKLVGNYCQEIGQLVQGSPSHRELMQTCNPAFNLFRLRIRGTAPNFVASTRAEAEKVQKRNHAKHTSGAQRSGSKNAPIVIDMPIKQIPPPGPRPETFVFGVANSSTTAVTTFGQTPNPFAPNGAGGATSTPRPISAMPAASSSNTSASPKPQSNGVAPSKLSIEPEAMEIDEPGEESEDSDGGMTEDLLRQPSPKKVAEPMYLDDIRKLVESHLTRELPFNVPFGAKVEAMTMCFEQWGNLSESCAETVIKAARNLTSGLSNKVFGGFKYGELDRTVKIVVECQIDKLAAQVKGRLIWLAEMEKVPYTLNKHYFQSYMDKYFKKYKAERQKIFSGEDKSDAIAQARALQFSSKDIEAIVAALRGPDPYEHELMVAAEVRAYFQVSYKRIIDNVPRIIDHDFIRLLRPSIESALHEKFFSDERSAGRYMAEDPEIVVFREDLETKLGRLLEISARLERSLDDD